MQILLKTKLAGSTWAGPSQILAGFGEPAKFVSCGTGLSKNVMFDCLSSRSTSFSKSHSNNFSLALKKFLVASLLRLSSHHPKLAVIISCHTNKTIYVLSCTKVALELLHCCCCCATPWATATKNVKKPPGKKGQTFRNVTWTQSDIFDFLNVRPFSPGHLLESNKCK